MGMRLCVSSTPKAQLMGVFFPWCWVVQLLALAPLLLSPAASRGSMFQWKGMK